MPRSPGGISALAVLVWLWLGRWVGPWRPLRWLQGGVAVVGVAAAVWLLSPLPVAERSPLWREEITAATYRSLAQYAGLVDAPTLAAHLEWVDPLGLLQPYYQLEGSTLRIRDQVQGEPVEITLALAPPSASGAGGAAIEKSLVGRRIVLDPGHHGGSWSRVEGRHVVLPRGSAGPALREGNLTLATARLLAEQLAAAGARVRFTREAIASAPFLAAADAYFDPNFEAAVLFAEQLQRTPWRSWWALYPMRLAAMVLRRGRAAMAREAPPFALYNRFDLRRRAAVAAAWQADLFISLHYNYAEEPQQNGVMVFVPGNFLLGELVTASQRYDAFRLLLDGQLAVTLRLARRLGLALQRGLGLAPLLDRTPEALPGLSYKRLLDADAGVFARNLAVLRRAHGPAVLLEGPCLNHPAEYTRLLKQEVLVDGAFYGRRIADYSGAVFSGLR